MGSTGQIALVSEEQAHDLRALEFADNLVLDLAQGPDFSGSIGGQLEVGGVNLIAGRHNHSALYDSFKFTHITGPSIVLQFAQGRQCETLWFLAFLRGNLEQEVSGKARNVVGAFAKGRDGKPQYVE